MGAPDLRALEAELREIGDNLGDLYRRRDTVLERLAELRGPAVLPKPRYQTDRQRLVSRCPRCGGTYDAQGGLAPSHSV